MQPPGLIGDLEVSTLKDLMMIHLYGLLNEYKRKKNKILRQKPQSQCRNAIKTKAYLTQ